MPPRSGFFSSRRARNGALALALLFVAVLVQKGIGEVAKQSDKKAQRAVLVTEDTVVEKAMPVEIATIGHVQAMASVAVKARADGQIAKVVITDGQEVKAGDVLAQLDDREAQAQLAQAKAALVRDQAQLEFANSEVERQRTLARRSVVSEVQLEQTRANAKALAGTVQSDEGMVAMRETELSYTVITAPIAGKVGSIAFKEGNTVQANAATPLMTINQMAPIFVGFSVAQRSLPALQDAIARGPVKVQAVIPGKDGEPETGELSFVENTIDPTTGTLGVKAAFANEAWRLWPGQFVNVVVTLKVEPRAVVVASVAVQSGQAGPYVFVVKADQTVELRNVEVDRTVGNETVIASGLAPGEKVVTTGQLRLVPGAKVKAQEPPPPGAAKGSTS